MLIKPKVYKKGWGREVWYHNSEKYAFKGLFFNRGGRSSLHFHMRKTETWLVAEGQFEITFVDARTAGRKQLTATQGMVFHIPAGVPHRIHCIQKGHLLEASTEHFENDSYRLEPGDSQKRQRRPNHRTLRPS